MTELSQTASRVTPPRGLAARWSRLRAIAAIGLVCAVLGACTGEQFQKGYILPPNALGARVSSLGAPSGRARSIRRE
jgi:hypothetical protein